MIAPKPFAHQIVSIKHNDKSPIVFDCSDPGTGKTFVRIASFAKRRAKGAGCLLVLAPRSLLRSVWVNDLKKFAPHLTVSVADAANRADAFARPADVYVTNVDAVKWLAIQKPAFFKKFSELVVDECFPAGTPVDTPAGPVFIERLKIGDLVNTSSGPLPVTRTFTKESNDIVKLTFDDGTTIRCTGNHPIATQRGWREARNSLGVLAVRLDIYQHAQQGPAVLQPHLQQDRDVGKQATARTASNDRQNSRKFAGQTDMEHRAALSRGNESQAQRGAQEVWAPTQDSRRQRPDSRVRSDDGRNAARDLGASTLHRYWAKARQRVSAWVQGGFCKLTAQTGIGSGRQFAQLAQTLGCEEGQIVGLSRVVSVTRVKHASTTRVFNIQVDGPHDYSVKGFLVHNCTAYKHHTSARSKAAAKIAKHFTHRCCMTGTPNSNSITDIWHQVQILDAGQRLGFSFYKFRDAVCTPTQVGRIAQAVRWIDKEGAEEAVFGLLQDIVVRHNFADCVDIPANHRYAVGYEMTSRQLKAYLELEQTQMLSLGKTAMTAVNAAAVRTKLLQVASGAVYDGLGGCQVIDTARYELVIDLAEQRKHSLVFFLWKHQRDALVAEADKRGLTFCVIDGSTSDRDREEMVRGYQAGVYRIMFAHPKSAAHGLTLTKGTATIWSSPTDDLEIFEQGSKRQHRMGQKEKTETVVVIAKGTFDEKVWDNMLSKGKRMANLLDLFGTLTPVAAAKSTPKKKKVMEPA